MLDVVNASSKILGQGIKGFDFPVRIDTVLLKGVFARAKSDAIAHSLVLQANAV